MKTGKRVSMAAVVGAGNAFWWTIREKFHDGIQRELFAKGKIVR